MNVMRHWYMWSAIEIRPGTYDWSDYDRMMELEAKHGIRVVIAELVTAAPEWAFEKYPHARFRSGDDRIASSSISASSATGGFPGLCLDNEDVRAEAEKFLMALVNRYRSHPATLGYDLWNENTYHGGSPSQMYCYCEATQRKFRDWLKQKYGSLEALGKAWHRYSFASWENVRPPRDLTGYPEAMDWLEFRIDNAFRLLRWRTELFRRLDPDHKIIAHGVAGTLETLPSAAHHEWWSAAEVDIWGFTWVASRKGSEPWKQFHAVDLVRSGARGKPFWHAEAQVGPLWMQPQVIGRAREDGRITEPEDVRLWNMVSCAGGASGILYPRWRPLLDGPLFGAFGPFAMDGSVTPRAEMAGRVARWANAHPEVWRCRPVRGDIGIVFAPESELFNYVQHGNTQHYAESSRGAYRAFFDSNIQADWVDVEHLSDYPVVYLPYPVMLKVATVRKLTEYVQQGGRLISEGLPGYFGDGGHAGEMQPNLGLDRLFGAREEYVEFTPDLLEDLALKVRDSRIHGRFFLQQYSIREGRQAGTYDNGAVAAVENDYGHGKALLIGTFPGAGYFRHPDNESKKFFARFLEWANVVPRVQSSDPDLVARLHVGPGGKYLWLVNPTRTDRVVTVRLTDHDAGFQAGEDVWQGRQVTVRGTTIKVNVGARDAAVIRLAAQEGDR
jgi:beta-galactosidase